MVGIITGNGMGVLRSSRDLLGAAGQIGSAAAGSGLDGVFVNAALGSVFVDQKDELIFGASPDPAISSNYGLDGFQLVQWGETRSFWIGSYNAVVGSLTGTVNTAGSTVMRRDSEGGDTVYTYDASKGCYVNTEGGGAYDELRYNGSNWVWTDGATRTTEVYASNNRLWKRIDPSGNTTTITWNAVGVSDADSNGESVSLVAASSSLYTFTATYQDASNNTVTRTEGYMNFDSSGRYVSRQYDLTPDDGSIADGNVYTIGYAYDSASGSLNSITQSDGSRIDFQWALVGGRYRITSFTEYTTATAGRTTTLSYDLTQGFTTVTDPSGQQTQIWYDSAERLTAIVSPPATSGGATQTTSFTYNANGDVTSVTDANGNATVFQYDANGNRTYERDAQGNVVTRTFNLANNRMLTQTRWLAPDPDGAGSLQPSTPVTTRYAYDANGRLRFQVSAEGRVSQHVYNSLGQETARLTYTGDAYPLAGWSDTQTVDEATMASWAAGRDQTKIERVDTTYDARGNVDTVTTYANTLSSGAGDPASIKTQVKTVYDRRGELVSRQVIGQSGSEVFAYDGVGRITSATDAAGHVTTISYQGASTTTTVSLSNGLTRTSVFDKAGDLLSVTESASDIPSLATSYAYDAAGRLRMTTDPSGRKSYILYDDHGRKAADIDGDGAVSEYRYDAGNRLVATIAWANTVNVAALVDGNGNPAAVTIDGIRPAADTKDGWTWRVYDHSDRVIETIDAMGGAVTYAYDGASRLVGTTAYATALTSTQIASLKATPPTSVQLPTADAAHDRTTRSFYDKDGLLVASLDAVGVLTQFVYDTAGNKVRETVSAAPVPAQTRASGTLADMQAAVGSSSSDARTDFVYDRQGRLRYEIAADGAATGHPREYVYDGTGKLIRTVDYAGSIALGSASVADVVAALSAAGLSASSLNRISRSVYDSAGQLAFSIDGEGATTAYTYDSLGNVNKIRRFAAPFTASGDPTYDAMQTWAATYKSDASDRITRSVYDSAGRLAFTVDAGGFVTGRTYDGAGRVLVETLYADAQNLTDWPTAAGLTAQMASVAVAARTTYGYDAAGRVTDVTRLIDTNTGATATTHYVLDAHGQAVDVYEAWGVAGEQSRTHRDYDAAGRLTAETRAFGVTGVEATVQYGYDALGDATTVTDALSHATVRNYDAAGHLLSVSVPLDASTSAVTTYTYDSFGHVAKMVDARLNSTFYYYDRLGRLTLEVDPENFGTQTAYTAFGDVQAVTRYATPLGAAPGVGAPPAFAADAKDATTQFEYDRNGRLTKATDGEGYHEDYVLNTFGERWKVTNKLNGQTVNTIDRRGLVTAELLPISSTDSSGTVQATSVTNSFEYDAAGNRTKMVEASNVAEARTTHYCYDALGRLIETQHDGVTVTDTGTLAATQSVTTSEKIAYDRRGNVIQTTDAGGARTFFYYDAADRKIASVDPTGALTAWTYDGNGNVKSALAYAALVALPTQPGGAPPAGSGSYRETDYGYDRANRLTDVTVHNLTTGEYAGGVYSTATGDVVTHTTYDAMGNVVRQQDGRGNSIWSWYDKAGRKTAQVDQENYLTVWTRDAEGNAKSETRYANAVASAFDQSTSVDSLKSSAGTSSDDRTTSFTYDRNGRRLTETRTGVRYATVSGTNASLTEATADATIVYTYNHLGQVASKQEATGDTTSYSYDAGGRLIGVTGPSFVDSQNATVQRSIVNAYDGLGNLTRTVQNGARITRYAYDASGRMSAMTDAANFTRSYGYDAAGRTVKESWTRTRSDNVTSVTEANVTRYDAAGRAVYQGVATYNGASWSFGDHSQLTYDAFGEVTAKGMNGLSQETFDYDGGGRLWRSTAGDGTAKIFVSDRNGATTLTISSSGGASGADLSTYSQAQALALFGSNLATASSAAVATIAVLDRRGQQVQERDPFRNLSQSVSAEIDVSRAYNAFGEVRSETDARGNVTNYSYNTMGRLLQKVSPSVSWTSETGAVASATPIENYYYDKSGRLVGTRDANLNFTTRTLLAGTGYDGAEASVLKEFHADGGIVETKYDVFGDARTLIDELNRVETRTYDAMDRLLTVAHQGGLLTDSYAYDGLGERTRHTNSVYVGAVERTDYDQAGRVILQTDLTGAATSYSYAWSGGIATAGLRTFGGWVKTTVNAASLTATDYLDYFGRTVSRTDFGGHTFNYGYNAAGELVTMSTVAGASVSYSYYNSGKLAQVVDNAGSGYDVLTSTYAYDAAGNRTYEGVTGTVYSYYLPSGTTAATVSLQSTSATYDALGRLVTITDLDGGNNVRSTSTTYYDLAGNIRHVASSNVNLAYPQNGAATKDLWYRYDSMNRMVVADGSLSGGTIVSGVLGAAMTYDLAGERKTMTHDAALTGYASVWVWYPDYDPANGAQLTFPQEGVNGEYQNQAVGYSGQRREEYSYRDDGYLMQVAIAESNYQDNGDGTASATDMGTGILRADYQRDALGRVTQEQHWDKAGQLSFNRYAISYDAANLVQSETVSELKVETGSNGTHTYTYVSTTTNGYGAGGVLNTTSVHSTKAGYGIQADYPNQDGAAPDTYTTNSYTWWDDARLSSSSFNPNTSYSTTQASTYAYDLEGRIAYVDIADGRRRTVSFASSAGGQVLQRRERSAATGNPEDHYAFLDGRQVAFVTNNGNTDPTRTDYYQGIRTAEEWQSQPNPSDPQFQNESFRWATTGGVTDSLLGPGSGYDPLNPATGAGGNSRYTVQAGDTLQGIAGAVWGDSSLWYLIADANGLSGGEALQAGQALTVPGKVTNIHNNAGTFRVYDPNKALGDLSPTAPKPAKSNSGCGVVGNILIAAVALAVTIASHGLLAEALGPVLGGAVTGAAASAVSQAFGVATGLQNGFSWKGVALAAISGGVSGGLDKLATVKGLGLGFLNGGSLSADIGRSVIANVAGQGIALGTGLQSKFDWAGVATAAVVGGVTGAIGRNFAPGSFERQVFGSASGLIAGAAARSLVTGTDFGDNVLAVLPDVIAATLGTAVVHGLAHAGSAASPDDDGAADGGLRYFLPPETPALPANYDGAPIVVTGTRIHHTGFLERIWDEAKHFGHAVVDNMEARLRDLAENNTFVTGMRLSAALADRAGAHGVSTFINREADFTAGGIHGFGHGAIQLLNLAGHIGAHPVQSLVFAPARVVDSAVQANASDVVAAASSKISQIRTAVAHMDARGLGELGGQVAFNVATAPVAELTLARVVNGARGVEALGGVADARATGAFSSGARVDGGLGIFATREVTVTPKGLDLVRSHLIQFGDVPANAAMVQRLEGAMASGQRVSGADAIFYTHEAAEATMMARGMSYDAAHATALEKYNVSPFSVYHPDVIQSMPEQFNSNWYRFWGITR